jgi:hypothetical protein
MKQLESFSRYYEPLQSEQLGFNFTRMFTYLNVCILSYMGTLLVTHHWRMEPQTQSQRAVPILWGDAKGDKRFISDKKTEIDFVTTATVYM